MIKKSNKKGLIFSVIIPTYNRSNTLVMSIKSVLNQDFDSYEILVLDDHSKDNTESVVKSFKDKRITYIKNEHNIGYARNIMKGCSLAKGEYIFLLSDDDFILKQNTFLEVYREMDEKHVGFGELRLIIYDEDYFNPYYVRISIDNKTLYYPPQEDILIKILDLTLGFVSGNVFKRDLIKKGDIISDVWYVYYKAIFRIVKKTGCLYFGNQFIMAKISKSGNIVYMDEKKNKGFHYKKVFKIYEEFEDSPIRLQLEKKRYLDSVVSGFGGTKYYTSNRNILDLAKGLIEADRNYLFNLRFWINLTIALLIPKQVFGFMRFMNIKYNQAKIKPVLREIKLKECIKKLRFNN